jgi:hypothetical protein
MAIDPFGKDVFGGQTSLGQKIGGQTAIPGGISAAAPTAAAAKPVPYKYAGQGWNDPLAQQMYQKYAFGGRISPNLVGQLAHMGDVESAGSSGGVAYHNPLDPKEWGGSIRGDDVEKMKAAYLAAGGQGTYDQLAATNPTSVGWPTDTGGNPLPKMDLSGGKVQTLYPSGAQGFQPPAPGSVQAMGGSGSMNSLSPDILKKMWR